MEYFLLSHSFIVVQYQNHQISSLYVKLIFSNLEKHLIQVWSSKISKIMECLLILRISEFVTDKNVGNNY